MLEFLKKIISSRDRELTFLLYDEVDPDSADSYTFRPRRLLVLFYAGIAVTVLVVLFSVRFTPLGTLVDNQQDKELRAQVVKVSRQVQMLRDSLEARDTQLSVIQQVLASGADTTFEIGGEYRASSGSDAGGSADGMSFLQHRDIDMLSRNEILFSGLFRQAPEFPAVYPVEGTFTGGYDPENGHYGIDIAVKSDTPFRALANGAVISQGWTPNYGYVIHVQHNDGLLSIYKHASSVAKAVGNIVLKGEILGTAGDAGLLSSGPHLHLEIWKNGVPQNPNRYLVKS